MTRPGAEELQASLARLRVAVQGRIAAFRETKSQRRSDTTSKDVYHAAVATGTGSVAPAVPLAGGPPANSEQKQGASGAAHKLPSVSGQDVAVATPQMGPRSGDPRRVEAATREHRELAFFAKLANALKSFWRRVFPK
jgi:hypothetical protein